MVCNTSCVSLSRVNSFATDYVALTETVLGRVSVISRLRVLGLYESAVPGVYDGWPRGSRTRPPTQPAYRLHLEGPRMP